MAESIESGIEFFKGENLFDEVDKVLISLRQCIKSVSDMVRFVDNIDEILTTIKKPFRIMLVGEFSTGKSTFINALIGKKVTVVDVVPTTAVITKFSYGDCDEVFVNFNDGSIKKFSPSEFQILTSEIDNSSKDVRKKIDFVERKVFNEFLKSMEIIDSPGLNSLEEGHENITREFVSSADVIVWVFDVQKIATKSEIDAFKNISLGFNLKPIVIINKMDMIDEDEGDDAENILKEVRNKLVNNKIEFQYLLGISAELAFTGKIKGNEEFVKESNIQEFYDVVSEMRQKDFEIYKKILVLNSLSEFIFDFGNFRLEKFSNSSVEKNANYSSYIKSKADFADSEDIFYFLFEFVAEYFQKHEMDFGLRIARKIFLGVLNWLENDSGDYYPDELEDAAVRNDETAKRILIKIFQSLNENEKADYWRTRLKVRNSEKNFVAGQKSEVSWQSSISLEELAKKYSANVFNILRLEHYKKEINSDVFGKINSIYKDEKFFEFNFEFYFKNAEKKWVKVVSKKSEKHFKFDILKQDWEEIKNLKKISFKFNYPSEENSVAGLKISRVKDSANDVENVSRERKFIPQENSQAKIDSSNMSNDEYSNGRECENNGNYDSAFHWYKQAADKGNGLAMLSLGNLYSEGRGVEKNYTEAIKWYKKSSEVGYEEARSKLIEAIRKKANLSRVNG